MNLSKDTVLNNKIRDALPFGDVFNFWREQMGACGMFEWNENLYLTLYKEENLIDCEINH